MFLRYTVPRADVGSFLDASSWSSARLRSFSFGAATGTGAPDMVADEANIQIKGKGAELILRNMKDLSI